MSYAVCVTIEIKPEAIAAFMPLMLANARASLREEAGCLQFDVLSDAARPGEVFLYEIYTSADAFQVHLQASHFLEFDAQVADMIVSKEVRTYAQVHA
jgi:autoinducer 2-degrading protein